MGAWWLLLSAWLTRVYHAARGRATGSILESDHRLLILWDAVRNYAIFQLDPHGAVLSWDAAAERLKGYRADEIIGQNYSRFYLQRDIDRGIPKQHLEAAAITGRVEVEHWRVRKDGTQFWAIVVITAVRNASSLDGFLEAVKGIDNFWLSIVKLPSDVRS